MKSDFYLQFENKFRGNRQTIIEKLSIYDSLMELFIKENTQISLLDIGCGRGEWLEKWKEIIPNSMGIEKDLNMINVCKDFGLNIIEGEAIEILSTFKSRSISVITIFHLIEHIDNENLTFLLEQCYRVLKDDGMLILETPSIDNLLVSSKLFYVDSTHVNHINPDRMIFDLEYLGFAESSYYYINGGPLESANSLKLTRIFNGVAQDLLIIACKGKVTSDLLFKHNVGWQINLAQAPSTLQAATSFDSAMESSFKAQSNIIHILNQEINLLKAKISLLENQLSVINKLLFPFIKTLRYSKQVTLYICTNIFSLMLNYRFTRLILNSKYTLILIRFFLKIFPLNLTNITYEKVHLAINKVNQTDIQSNNFNKNLLTHYNTSKNAKKIKISLIDRIFRKS